jgi:hypothetical protein
MNYGQRPFAYTPPTDFLAVNTYNIPDSTIVKGNSYFDVTTYTGDGTTRTFSNLGFTPDFVWTKSRSNAISHILGDRVRGNYLGLSSDLSGSEGYNNYTQFNAAGSNSYTQLEVNNVNTYTFVNWLWRAGNTSGSSDTSGTITSTVSVNTTAGFSIVTYTSSSGTNTVGHGLGVAPKMVIWKSRTNATDWVSYHASLGASKYINLNSTAAAVTNNLVWNNTAPTSTVVTIGSDLSTYGNIVMYCWAEIAGFSKFGSYTGNGSADGVFVYTGFRPKWILVKQSSAAGEYWNIIDASRSPYNVSNARLSADQISAESTAASMDLLSNGFKIRETGSGTNTNGATYIYMAFAENPFKVSNAR